MKQWTWLACLWLGFFAIAAAAEEAPRTVSVQGEAEVRVVPDRAVVRLGAEARAPGLENARKRVDETAARLLALMDELDIDRDAVSTTGLQVRPEYDWRPERGEQQLKGYFVARQFEIRLDDLDKLGEVIDGSIKLGVNQATPPELGSSRRAELRREALALAAEDARRNAQALAEALDAAVGRPVRVSASDAGQPRPVPMRARARASAAAADTFTPGEVGIVVRVHAEFELLDR